MTTQYFVQFIHLNNDRLTRTRTDVKEFGDAANAVAAVDAPFGPGIVRARAISTNPNAILKQRDRRGIKLKI